MTKKKGLKWTELPAGFAQKLVERSGVFTSIKDIGRWIEGPGGYEPEVFCILRTHTALSYDVFIPAIIRLMRDGVLTTIFPVGMKTMDVVFHEFEPDNPFDENAYVRGGIIRKGDQ